MYHVDMILCMIHLVVIKERRLLRFIFHMVVRLYCPSRRMLEFYIWTNITTNIIP